MINLLRKILYLGLGTMSVTREKTEEWVDEMVRKLNIDSGEANRIVKELVEKGEQEREALTQLIRKEIERLRVELGLISRSELRELENRLISLEQKMQKLEVYSEASNENDKHKE